MKRKRTVEFLEKSRFIRSASDPSDGVLVYYLGIWCMDAPYVGGLYTPLPLWLCVATCLAASTILSAGLKDKELPAWFKAALTVFVVMVCLAVCFVKQHSAIDVLAALPVCLIAELAVYGKDYWKPRCRFVLRKTKKRIA